MAFKKDPNAVLDYSFDWSAYLTPLTDTIPVNVAEINSIPVSGAGVTGNEWGPA